MQIKYDSESFSGQVVLITAGAAGIGRSIAEKFLSNGCCVHICDIDPAAIDDFLADNPSASASVADVSDVGQVEALFKDFSSRYGRLDILVNNAGIAITRGIDDLTEDDFDRTILVNLKSAFLCTQAVLPSMRSRKWGRIVNISSGAARGAGSIGPHYNASKAGMEGLTRGYAARLVKEGITVNAVAPSLIETDMMSGQPQLVSRIPLGRFGTAEEVAKAVMLLVDNAYMTGQTVALSGGMAFN